MKGLDIMEIIKSNRGYDNNNLNVPKELKRKAERSNKYFCKDNKTHKNACKIMQSKLFSP